MRSPPLIQRRTVLAETFNVLATSAMVLSDERELVSVGHGSARLYAAQICCHSESAAERCLLNSSLRFRWRSLLKWL